MCGSLLIPVRHQTLLLKLKYYPKSLYGIFISFHILFNLISEDNRDNIMLFTTTPVYNVFSINYVNIIQLKLNWCLLLGHVFYLRK